MSKFLLFPFYITVGSQLEEVESMGRKRKMVKVTPRGGVLGGGCRGAAREADAAAGPLVTW